MTSVLLSKIESGIPGFDEITGGGIPKSAAIALIGRAGAGKEVLARHIAWNILQRGSKVLYVSVSQSADELRYNMLSYGWDVTPFEENNQLRIVDVFTHSINNQIDLFDEVVIDDTGDAFQKAMAKMFDIDFICTEWIDFLQKSLKEKSHTLCIFDSISPLLTTSTKGVFRMIITLKNNIKIVQGTGIYVIHSRMHDEEIERAFLSLVDGTIEVTKSNSETDFIRIDKYPNEHKSTPFPIEITPSGVDIIPIEMPDYM
jgi:KaiC/GvpD/RAD55 family RecA-like ATPase